MGWAVKCGEVVGWEGGEETWLGGSGEPRHEPGHTCCGRGRAGPERTAGARRAADTGRHSVLPQAREGSRHADEPAASSAANSRSRKGRACKLATALPAQFCWHRG